MREQAAQRAAGVADNVVRRGSYDRNIPLLYVTGRRLSCMERGKLKRYRKKLNGDADHET